MACPTANMNDCNKKCRCVGGPCADTAYNCDDPCSSGIFVPSTCECFDASGTWRIVVTTYISPGGMEGYTDVFYIDDEGNAVCVEETPGLLVGVYKSDPDSGPNSFPWVLEEGDYMYVYCDLPDDSTATYYRDSNTPDDSNNGIGFKWNKTANYYRGPANISTPGESSPIYVVARDEAGNIVKKGGSFRQWIDPSRQFNFFDYTGCSRGPNTRLGNPFGYAQGVSNISYEKWDEQLQVWVPQATPS